MPLKVEANAQKSEGVTGTKRKLDHEERVSSLGAMGKKARKDSKNKEKERTVEEDNKGTRSEGDSGSAGEGESSDNGYKRTSSCSSEDEDDSFEPSKIMHESLQKSNKSQKAGPKKKYVPQDETAAQRDLRTVFVGNLSVEVVKKRVCLLPTI